MRNKPEEDSFFIVSNAPGWRMAILLFTEKSIFMAQLTNGILGPFIGTASNVTGYMMNGKNFVRTRRRKSAAPKTPKRLAQQQKIKVCNVFTKPFCGTGFFNKTFPAYESGGTGFSRATSAIMRLAIMGTYPDFVISYPLALISRGSMPPAENAAATRTPEGNLLFNWTDNSCTGTAKRNDKVVLVAYFPNVNQAVFSIGDAERADCGASLETHTMQGYTAETWIGFLSNDENDAANSVYAGKIAL